MIPPWVQSGLKVAGNMLPALGFALLMNLMLNKKVAPYFFLGFMLAAYLKLLMIAIGGLGVIIALIVTQVTPKEVPDDEEDIPEETTEEPKKQLHKCNQIVISGTFFSDHLRSKQILILKHGKIQVLHLPLYLF